MEGREVNGGGDGLEKEKTVVHKYPSPRHLYLCRIRCRFGTDDVFFPFLLALAIRATWVFVSIGTIVYLFLRPGCLSLPVPVIFIASLIGFVAIQLAGLFNDLVVMAISNLGSLAVSEPRKKIEFFIYVAFLIYFIEVGWDSFSTYTVFSDTVTATDLINCTSYTNVLTIYRAVVLIDWAVLAAIFVIFSFFLDPLGCCMFRSMIRNIEADLERLRVESVGASESGEYRPGVHKNYIDASLWLHRCKRQYCQCLRRGGLSSSEQEALSDVVRAFGVLFSDVDCTFTDVLSGFRLALSYQRNLKRKSCDPTEEMRNVTVKLLKDYNVVDIGYKPPSPEELAYSKRTKVAADLKYYLDYAMATYGWPVHVYLNPCTGPFSLCATARCNCCCARCQIQQFDGDTCYPNPAAIKAIAGVPEENIIDACFVNSVHIVPFYVAVDNTNNRKDLVIAVRGTLSIKDVLTDVSVSMEKEVDGLLGVKPCFVHRGFYAAAKGIFKHIMAPNKHRFRDMLTKENYRIVLTGHSLGAAVASVLAVLFKERLPPEMTKDLKAYTFSTPGAVFDYQLAKMTEPFILSVVGGNDMVPRMTMRGLAHLKMSVTDLIVKCNNTKQQVLCCTGCCGWQPTIPREADLLKLVPTEADIASLHSLDLAIDETRPRPAGLNSIREGLPFTSVRSKREQSRVDLPFNFKEKLVNKEEHKLKKRFTKDFLERLNDLESTLRGECMETDEEERPMMFIPGRILHLEEGEEYATRRCCGIRKTRRIVASWKSKEEFSAIVVHTSMVLDHGPSRTVDFINHFYDQTGDNTTSQDVAMETVKTNQSSIVPRYRPVSGPF